MKPSRAARSCHFCFRRTSSLKFAQFKTRKSTDSGRRRTQHFARRLLRGKGVVKKKQRLEQFGLAWRGGRNACHGSGAHERVREKA